MRATPPTRRTPSRAAEAVALALLLTAAAAAAAPPRAYHPPGSALDVDVAASYDADGRPSAVVHVRVPYRGLIFTRSDGSFESELQVSVVAVRDGKRVGGGFGSSRARVDDYESTRSDGKLACSVKVAFEGDAPVSLELEARVRDTSRTWRTKLRFDPGAGSGVPWYFAGFDWNVPDPGDVEVGAGPDTLQMAVTLVRLPRAVSPQPPPATTLSVRVTDSAGDGRVVLREAVPSATAGDTLVEDLAVAASSLPFGPLRLDVSLSTGEGGHLDMSPPRELTNLRLPWADDESWRRQVGWLEGIADGDTRHRLADLPPAQRKAAWRALWDSRPPGARPTEREHLMRIVEADRRFGRFGRGALSDRGRVFIRLGPPDDIETRTMDPAYPGQWEIWYYRREGIVYRFYDAYGLGDYRLYDTAPY